MARRPWFVSCNPQPAGTSWCAGAWRARIKLTDTNYAPPATCRLPGGGADEQRVGRLQVGAHSRLACVGARRTSEKRSGGRRKRDRRPPAFDIALLLVSGRPGPGGDDEGCPCLLAGGFPKGAQVAGNWARGQPSLCAESEWECGAAHLHPAGRVAVHDSRRLDPVRVDAHAREALVFGRGDGNAGLREREASRNMTNGKSRIISARSSACGPSR